MTATPPPSGPVTPPPASTTASAAPTPAAAPAAKSAGPAPIALAPTSPSIEGTDPVNGSTRFLEIFGGSLALPAAEKVKASETAFTTFQKNVLSTGVLLGGTRLPGADEKAPTLTTLLKDAGITAATGKLKAILDGVLTPPADVTLTKAIADFKNDAETLHQALMTGHIELIDFPAHLKQIQKTVLDAAEADQKAHFAVLEKTLQAPATHQAIADALQIPLAEAGAVAEHLVKEIETTQKKQLADLRSSMSTAHEKLREHNLQEQRRLAYLTAIANANEELRQKILAITNADQPTGTYGALQAGALPSDFLKGVTLDRLQGSTTITGMGLTKSGGSFALEAGVKSNTLFQKIKYFFEGDARLKTDLLCMACALKAEGCDTVDCSISGISEGSEAEKGLSREKAKALARKTYEACILAGFPPEKINISWLDPSTNKQELLVGTPKGENKEKEPSKSASDELFTDAKQTAILEAIHTTGERVRAELDASITSHKSPQQLKEELDKLRASPGYTVKPTEAYRVTPTDPYIVRPAAAAAEEVDDGDDAYVVRFSDAGTDRDEESPASSASSRTSTPR